MNGNAMVDYGRRDWRDEVESGCDCGRKSCEECTPECPACDMPRTECRCVLLSRVLRITIETRRGER